MEVTPSLVFTLGPSVPDDVPYVGGTTIFGVDLNLSNPLTLDWESCEPDAITLGTGGTLTSNAYFMGGKLEPGFLDKDLYGPLSHTIDTGFSDINCEDDPVPVPVPEPVQEIFADNDFSFVDNTALGYVPTVTCAACDLFGPAEAIIA